MAYSIDALTDDCYEGTSCLMNKLDIRDEDILAQTEAAITLAKVSWLDQHPIVGGFDLSHLQQIHHFLLCDLYPWAGLLRTINLSKKGTNFVFPEEIERCANAAFARIADTDFSNISSGEFVHEAADFYHTINMLHPFREGNGRTQRIFFAQWSRHHGYEIDFAQVDPDELMIATILAAQGVMDGLEQCFRRMVATIAD